MKTLRFARVLWLFALLTLCACPASKTTPSDAGTTADPVAGQPTGLEPPALEERIAAAARAQSLHPTAAPVDTRTPAQIQQAACTAADGSWRCRAKRPVVLAAGASPIIPASWTVPAWFIDPANSTTTASDGNDCASAVTPCLTWQEINVHRWGCLGVPTACPRLRQTTTLTFQSNQTTNADPVDLSPSIEGASIVSLVGSLGATQQIVSGVLAGVVTATRSPTQLTNATLGAGVAIGSLIVNSTHPSRAWVYKNVAGATWALSQPTTPQLIPGTIQPAEVNTWANGDAYVAYNPVQVFVTHIGSTTTGWNAAFNNNFYVNSINFFSSNGVVGEEVKLDATRGDVVITESLINRSVSSEGASYISGGFNNCAFLVLGTPKMGGTPALARLINAGFLAGGTLANVNLGGDIIISGNLTINGTTNAYSNYYVETGITVAIRGGPVSSQAVAGGPIIWGPGTLNVTGSTRFLYTSTAVAHLLVGTLQLNGATTAHSIFTLANVDTPCGGITLNPTALDLAASATCATTGFGGLAFNPGGAAYTSGAL